MSCRWKSLILLFILMILSLIFTCCASTKVVATSQVDSVRVEIRERIVEVPITAEIEIPEISERQVVNQDSSSLANDYAKSEAKILPDGSLYHSLETIPQKIGVPMIAKIPLRDTMIFRQNIGKQLVEVPRELTAWQKFRLDGFWVLLILIAGFVGVKLLLLYLL
ncbi:MAG: hypothetical protein SNI49_03330 [Rikenellaceae bacterium]